jgi:hypothetical protein
VRRPGIVPTIGTAWVGVVVGHIVAYLLGYPSAGPRHDHLVVTGHSWFGVATASLLAVVPVVMLTVAVRAIRSGGSWSGSALAFRLVAIQVPAFLLIEAVERRGSLGQALLDPSVFIGVVLQPLLAVLAAWLLDLFGRAVRAVAARLRPQPCRALRSLPRPVPATLRPRLRLLLPLGGRAPPLPLAA